MPRFRLHISSIRSVGARPLSRLLLLLLSLLLSLLMAGCTSGWGTGAWLLPEQFMLPGREQVTAQVADQAPDQAPVQGVANFVREIYPSEWGMREPRGIAYLGHSDQLILLAQGDASAQQTALVTITPYEDLIVSATLPFALADTINSTYDDATGQLLLLAQPDPAVSNRAVPNQAVPDLVRVPMSSEDAPALDQAERITTDPLGIGQAVGMAFDATSHRLYILDGSAPALVAVDLTGEPALLAPVDLAPVDLSGLGVQGLRGLALHPTTHTLFTADPVQQLLYEIGTGGELIARYDLAPLGLVDVRGLAFGPSADLTDAAETVHLFVVDGPVVPTAETSTADASTGDASTGDASNRSGGSEPRLGRVVEAALLTETKVEMDAGQALLRFAVIGDFGKEGDAAARVAALVHGWNPDFILTTGDNNYPDGAASTIDANIGQYYSRYIGAYQGGYGPGSPTNRFWPTLGNHDWHGITCTEEPTANPTANPAVEPSETPAVEPAVTAPVTATVPVCTGAYFDYFMLPHNERYYSVDYGLVRLFALDSENAEPDGRNEKSVQAAWLREQLAASQACYNIVFFHRAPYSSGRHGSYPIMQWPFAQWGADAVLNGHDHVYERLTVDGIPYFVNGVGGARLYDFENSDKLSDAAISAARYNQDAGAMLVTATPTGITYAFYATDGALVDSYTVPAACPSSTILVEPSWGE